MHTKKFWAIIIFIGFSLTGLLAFAGSTEPGYINAEVLTAKAELQDAQTEYARLRETKEISSETQSIDRSPAEMEPPSEVTPQPEEKHTEERAILRKI
jgi:hypothetical protein